MINDQPFVYTQEGFDKAVEKEYLRRCLADAEKAEMLKIVEKVCNMINIQPVVDTQ